MTEKRYDQTANEKGMVLILALFSLSLLISSILICVFLMGEELNQDARYQENIVRIQKVRRAFLGKMADVPRRTEITNCGGLISEYGGILVRFKDTPKWVLKKPDEAVEWHYDKEHHFWAGWRGPYYIPPPGEDNLKDEEGNLVIMDGWGYPFEISSSCLTLMIFSNGKDGKPTSYSYRKDYDRDIKSSYITNARQFIRVRVNNRTDHDANLIVEVVYPFKGQLTALHSIPWIIDAHKSYTYYMVPVTPLTSGVRKASIRDVNTHEIKASKAFCIWYAGGNSKIIGETEIDYEG